jgi:hypothetical protein
MLKEDIRQLDCDDSTMTYEERLELYKEEWNEVLSGKSTVTDASELADVLEREGELGHRPVDLYTKPPFSTIARIMKKEGLSTTDVGGFLRWKAKADNMKAARAAKATKRSKTKKDDPAARARRFFEFKKQTKGEF